MFVANFCKKPRQIGAILPSSTHLARAMTERISLHAARNIAELGAGTGAFTAQILRKKAVAARFLAVELNAQMAGKLAQKFAGLDIEIGRAQELRLFLQMRGLGRLDAVVCGIPWMFLRSHEQDELLGEIYESLAAGGYFTTFIYAFLSPLKRRRFERKLRAVFGEILAPQIVWANVPPALVYRCKK